MFVVGALLLSSGCASTSYMGISLASGVADPEIQELALRARAGDKQAQFDLGKRFEGGDGIQKDVERARRLYSQAANDAGGTLWIYSPPLAGETYGRMTPFHMGISQKGLAAAKYRLKSLGK